MTAVRRKALPDELRTEDWRQSPTDLPAECEADGPRAFKRNPVALGCESTAGDAVAEFDQTWIAPEGFGRSGLQNAGSGQAASTGVRCTYLLISTSLEERGDAHEAVVVVPHNSVDLARLVVGKDECILEDWEFLAMTFSRSLGSSNTLKSVTTSLAEKALLLASVRDVSWKVSNQAFITATRRADAERLVLGRDLSAKVGAQELQTGNALVGLVLDMTLGGSSFEDGCIFGVLGLGGRWGGRGGRGFRTRCGSRSRSVVVCEASCCYGGTGGSIVHVMVDEVADPQHVDVGRLCSLLTCNTITTTVLASRRVERLTRVGKRCHGVTRGRGGDGGKGKQEEQG